MREASGAEQGPGHGHGHGHGSESGIRPGETPASGDTCADVVLGSRVRLARNVAGSRFLSRADLAERTQLVGLLQRRTTEAVLAPVMRWVDLSTAPASVKSMLAERRLISRQHAKGDAPRGVAISQPDERLAIMVNEEDHLRIQALRPGLALREAYGAVDAADAALEAKVDYAYCPKFGYLTACPTNVGTGMRVSVMLHLPGLMLTGGIKKTQRAARAMNLAMRGAYGEGSDSAGDIVQLSNQTTLGKSEDAVLEGFCERALPAIVEYERLARKTIAGRGLVLEDKVRRALATLRSARLLEQSEAVRLLSHVRLGVVMGMLGGEGVVAANADELMLLSQPAHLQAAVGRQMGQSERRGARAALVRRRLGGD